MDLKYRWKNGVPPTREEALRHEYLLDEDQFDHPKDREVAEEQARRYLDVPTRIPDDDTPVLPQ